MVLIRLLRAAKALPLALALGLPGAFPGVAAAQDGLPFPIEITPEFSLVTHEGEAVTEADFAGRAMLVFFGYANCESICTVALPAMAGALDLLGDDRAALAPILITVDPARDTPEAMREKLPDWHADLIGLTGPEEALAAARSVFGVESKVLFTDPTGQPVYAHGSFIYLFGPEGELKAMLPPILAPERIAELIRKHLGLGAG